MKSDYLLFVIHKHKATNLHYDFRIEVNGVMPSWAIAKGPTLDNAFKRLALPTTDHSMEYRNFEGVIAEGEYGAGPVMIWDEGYYIPEIEISKGVREEITDRERGEKVMMEGMEKGEIKFVLHGKKMKGSFAMVKTKGWGPKNSWLLIKHKDDHVVEGYDANDYDFSAVSKKSIEEIAEAK
jgi:bifunctional non-homologous end joining protein LigD